MEALDALRLQIEWGADEALLAAPVDRTAAPARGLHPPGQASAPSVMPPAPMLGPAARAADLAALCGTLAELRGALETLEGCALRLTATSLVFADGNPHAGLMFVGEAPGAEEDRAGLPFVGPSGRFLDRMLASIGLDRSKFLITNLIPWRPPGNRNPTDSEVSLCLPFLLRHVALARPRRLVLLGGLATRAITGNAAGIRRTRGRWLDLAVPGLEVAVPTLPMLHPAYLLRTPGAKREAWADLIMLRRALDADLSGM
ncbi:MAG: uracil-DNA glycosylase [Acidisphaera sp.]|nr:uracil-DNA glycosylase [Acidisphaera sp.]